MSALTIEPRPGFRCWVHIQRGVISGDYPIDAINMALRAINEWGHDEVGLGGITVTRSELERMVEVAAR